MNFDDVQTDSVSAQDGELDQLAGMVANGQTITCRSLTIDTDAGPIKVSAYGMEIEIASAEDEDDA